MQGLTITNCYESCILQTWSCNIASVSNVNIFIFLSSSLLNTDNRYATSLFWNLVTTNLITETIGRFIGNKQMQPKCTNHTMKVYAESYKSGVNSCSQQRTTKLMVPIKNLNCSKLLRTFNWHRMWINQPGRPDRVRFGCASVVVTFGTLWCHSHDLKLGINSFNHIYRVRPAWCTCAHINMLPHKFLRYAMSHICNRSVSKWFGFSRIYC